MEMQKESIFKSRWSVDIHILHSYDFFLNIGEIGLTVQHIFLSRLRKLKHNLEYIFYF